MRGRYLLANAVGAAVDLAVALAVNAMFAPPLWVAAAIGVLAGSVVNYFTHEYWTFGAGGRFSTRRMAGYLVACGLVLLLRAGAVAVLQSAFRAVLSDAVILVTAFAVSFVANYLLAARLFRRS